MRAAIKLAYDGAHFHGSQRQPKQRTVEGDLIAYLRKTKIIKDEKKANFQMACRTDKGVSAMGNVAAFDTEDKGWPEKLDGLEDVWVRGTAKVDAEFNARHARLRWYRYFLPDEGYNVDHMMRAARQFVGERDFTSFSKKDKSRDVEPVRSIDSIVIDRKAGAVVIDVRARAFLWNQVRRIVAALQAAELDDAAFEDIGKALEGRKKVDFGVAPAEHLVLMDVEYGFGFEPVAVKEKTLAELEGIAHAHSVRHNFYRELRELY